MKIIGNSINTESIIEYLQKENSPYFRYDESIGAIYIVSNESKWLFYKNKTIKMNSRIYYDNKEYNLLIIPNNISRINFIDKFIKNDTDEITVVNNKIYPIHIKKGECLGIAILIPRIESHIVNISIN